jgi:hypothetical protein
VERDFVVVDGGGYFVVRGERRRERGDARGDWCDWILKKESFFEIP